MVIFIFVFELEHYDQMFIDTSSIQKRMVHFLKQHEYILRTVLDHFEFSANFKMFIDHYFDQVSL